MAIIAVNVTLAVQASLGTALTITGITKANPGVVTSTAHGLSDGAIVVFTMAAGMVELDGQAVRIANKTTDTFELEGLDTTDYSTFTAGTCKTVATYQTFSAAQTISAPNPTPNKIDITTLIDKTKQYAYGLPEAPDGSITALFNPGGAAELLIKTATKANTPLVFRVAWPAGQYTICNANVSGGSGFDAGVNDAAKASVSFTPIKDLMHYSS